MRILAVFVLLYAAALAAFVFVPAGDFEPPPELGDDLHDKAFARAELFHSVGKDIVHLQPFLMGEVWANFDAHFQEAKQAHADFDVWFDAARSQKGSPTVTLPDGQVLARRELSDRGLSRYEDLANSGDYLEFQLLDVAREKDAIKLGALAAGALALLAAILLLLRKGRIAGVILVLAGAAPFATILLEKASSLNILALTGPLSLLGFVAIGLGFAARRKRAAAPVAATAPVGPVPLAQRAPRPAPQPLLPEPAPQDAGEDGEFAATVKMDAIPTDWEPRE